MEEFSTYYQKKWTLPVIERTLRRRSPGFSLRLVIPNVSEVFWNFALHLWSTGNIKRAFSTTGEILFASCNIMSSAFLKNLVLIIKNSSLLK